MQQAPAKGRPQQPVLFGGPLFVLYKALAAASDRLTAFHEAMGVFLGALAVGVGSNLYALWRDRPAQVPLTPGVLILVPGSVGFRSLEDGRKVRYFKSNGEVVDA